MRLYFSVPTRITAGRISLYPHLLLLAVFLCAHISYCWLYFSVPTSITAGCISLYPHLFLFGVFLCTHTYYCRLYFSVPTPISAGCISLFPHLFLFGVFLCALTYFCLVYFSLSPDALAPRTKVYFFLFFHLYPLCQWRGTSGLLNGRSWYESGTVYRPSTSSADTETPPSKSYTRIQGYLLASDI